MARARRQADRVVDGWTQIDALKITIMKLLSDMAAETLSSTRQHNWAERRGFAIVVGHLGGICTFLPSRHKSG